MKIVDEMHSKEWKWTKVKMLLAYNLVKLNITISNEINITKIIILLNRRKVKNEYKMK